MHILSRLSPLQTDCYTLLQLGYVLFFTKPQHAQPSPAPTRLTFGPWSLMRTPGIGPSWSSRMRTMNTWTPCAAAQRPTHTTQHTQTRGVSFAPSPCPVCVAHATHIPGWTILHTLTSAHPFFCKPRLLHTPSSASAFFCKSLLCTPLLLRTPSKQGALCCVRRTASTRTQTHTW